MQRIYLVYCNGGVFEAGSIREALEKALNCSSLITIYRAVHVATLEPNEVKELLEQGKRLQSEKVQKDRLIGKRLAIVFDQMFKGFAEVLERETTEEFIEFHEVLGRGIDKTLKLGPRLFQQPARDDYDVIKLLEHLAKNGAHVLFFTGDKRLAMQVRMIKNVRVEYLPPSEVAGKEAAIKLMLEKIRSTIRELETS